MKTKQSVTANAAWRSFLGLTVACAAVATATAEEYTKIKPYAVAVSADYVLQPLLSVGDQVPNTSDPSKTYQMVGIPDGLGATKGHGNSTILYMNHELGNLVQSEPNVGGALNRGAFVSRFILDKNACVVSGERAYNAVHDEEFGTVLPAPEVGNTTPGFGRFCSGSLSYKEAGFDRPIYFANEESGPGQVYDPKGALVWAVFDNEIHSLVKHGRFAWENALVRPDAGEWTVVMGMEDGPATPDNQLYMYVGKKNRAPGASALSRNGLDTGKLYTFVANAGSPINETAFTTGSITGRWVELPDQTSRTGAQLEADSDAVGAFGFIRIEDGAWSKKDKNKFYFVTTGSGTGNQLGAAYEVNFDKNNILGTTTISVIYNGDAVAAAGGDIGFAPDNIDVSKDYLMICEDGTTPSRLEYAKRARDGSIWRHDLKNNFAAKRVVELNPPGTARLAPANPPTVGAGVWETSGIIDTSDFYGKDSWLFVVQAHGPSLAPVLNTVEDGQLLLMLPGCAGDDDDDDRD
ncbi:MAG: alkaline phosphatase PhoX [Chthoniobacteraceae bacterium]